MNPLARAAQLGSVPFRVGSIPVELDLSFLVVVAVFGVASRPTGFALAGWVVVVVVSVLAHELGHALVYRAFGKRPRIVLSLLFGVTYGEHLPPGRAILVSLAGPMTGVAIGGAALALQGLLPVDRADWRLLLADVVWINLGWGLFNLVPMLPLDGGNVAASVLALAGRERARRDALLLSFAAAVAIVGVSFAVGFPYAGILALWLSAGNLESLREIRDEPLSERVRIHGRELIAGDYDRAIEGLARVERAARSQSAAAAARSGLALAMLVADRADDAEAVFGRSSALSASPIIPLAIELRRGRLDPTLVERIAEVREILPSMAIARAAVGGGKLEELAGRAAAMPPAPGSRTLRNLQVGLHFIRCHREAIRVGEVLRERSPTRPYVAVLLAGDHAALGNVEVALGMLVAAADAGFDAPHALDDDPLFDRIRALPPFGEVRARIVAASPDVLPAPAEPA